MKVVIYPPLDEQRTSKLRDMTGLPDLVFPRDDSAAMREIADADGFVGKLTPALLATAGRLRWVQSPTASLEHYLFPELIEHSCTLTNMRGLFSDVIAEQVLGYILCFTRHLHTYLRQQAEKRWDPVGGEADRTGFVFGPGVETAIDRAHRRLADCRVGIIGVGEIGREIARLCERAGMHVSGVDVRPAPVPGSSCEVRPFERLDELLADSDFVVIAAPHTPRTAGLFDATRLSRMQRSAVLINIGRGAIVRLADLSQALVNGTIAGAALDVYEIEPLPRDHVLWGLPNVILTPHIAGCAVEVPRRHFALFVDNLRRFAAGEPLKNVVDKREWC
jgi:phosphoglycerate dehydrogenase-like enzyme